MPTLKGVHYDACLAWVSQAATNNPLSLRERVGVRGRADRVVSDSPHPRPLSQGERGAKTQSGKILPGFMMPLGSKAALMAFMYSISTGERLYVR